jgi:hypothetical protein
MYYYNRAIGPMGAHAPSSFLAMPIRPVVGTLWFAVVPEASEQRLDSHQAVLHAYIFQRILGSDVDRATSATRSKKLARRRRRVVNSMGNERIPDIYIPEHPLNTEEKLSDGVRVHESVRRRSGRRLVGTGGTYGGDAARGGSSAPTATCRRDGRARGTDDDRRVTAGRRS